MKAFLQRVERWFDRGIVTLAWVAGGLMMFVSLAVCVDVVLRYFFNRPMLWVLETSEYVLLYIPFLAAAYVLREESHIRIDILLNRLGRRAQHRLNAVTSVLACGVLLVLAYYSGYVTLDFFHRDVPTIKSLKIPEYLVIAVIPLGFFLFALQFLRRARDQARAASRIQKDDPGDGPNA